MVAKILIIAEDEAVRDSLCALLQSFSYDVAPFASGEEFFGRMSIGGDCLLVDQSMPGMCGLDVLEHLYATDDPIPAVLMSGHCNFSIALRAECLGVNVLPKPVPEEMLLMCIERVCKPRAV